MMAGVLLIGANLRASITAVGPVLGDIRTDIGIGGATASALISLPLIGFALISPLAPAVARRIGLEWSLGGSLLLLMAAIVIRSVPVVGAIWVGTALLGVAIAMLNVLLPALVKREYPERVGAVTGLYSAFQTSAAAFAAGLAVPIAGDAPAGWRLSLGVWAGLAIIGFAVFLPQLRRRAAASRIDTREAAGEVAPPARMWRSALAWQVTLFLGLQSTVFYTVITWWPSIEHHDGVTEVVAGWHQFLFQAVGIAATLTAAALLQRLRDQRALIAGFAVSGFIAIVGQLLAPGLAVVWVVFVGASAGASIVIALSLFGLRTRNHHDAAALSGMAQSIGYLIAALGPFFLGLLHDVTGLWQVPLIVLLAVVVGQFVFGILAGRDRFVGEEPVARS